MSDGMYGGREINQAMAIFLLKCNHGMKESEDSGASITINLIQKYAGSVEDGVIIEDKKASGLLSHNIQTEASS